jgi:hypothetical protein
MTDTSRHTGVRLRPSLAAVIRSAAVIAGRIVSVATFAFSMVAGAAQAVPVPSSTG